MKKDVKVFLESERLEEYLMGTCCEKQVKEVEHYINTYPEVKAEFESLKAHIEVVSDKLASNSPKGMKDAIISCLEDENQYKLKSHLIKKQKTTNTFVPWAAAIIGVIASIAFFNQKQGIAKMNMEMHAELNMVKHQLETAQSQIEAYEEELAISGHSKTERIVLTGNTLSPDFDCTAFWNDVAKKGIIYVNNPGKLDKNHCYQIWADVEGKMVNAGIMPCKKGSIELNYLENASSLNITIEPKGGSEHPTVEKIVSSMNLIKI